MPVIQLYTAAGPQVEARLRSVCDVAAKALGLRDDDVVGVHVPTGISVRSQHADVSWPMVVIHGSPRERALMDRTVTDIREVVSTWTPAGESWVTWQVPQ